MNYKMTRYILGQLSLMVAAILLIPFIMSLLNAEDKASLAFGITTGALIVLGLIGVIKKPKNREIKARCGIITVALAWILLSVFGCLPFWISGYIPNFFDCFFETVSGFTTTGSTILTDIESLPDSLLFWRSFTHWLGGMGVLVLAIALLPKNDPAIVHLMKAEVPGPQFGKLVSKIRFTARILYGIYIALTLIEVIALRLCGMNLFDSFIHAFGTAGTGGFSSRNSSIQAYDSVSVDIVITVFMIIFSINFNLFFFALIGHFKDAIKSEELRVLLGIFMFSTIAISLSLVVHDFYSSFGEALRYGSFQVASIMSTTGYMTADFTQWPLFCQVLLLILMFIGGSAGSTAGGLKVSRVIILAKSTRNSFKKSVSPLAFLTVRMDGKAVDNSLISSVTGYFLLYVTTFFVSLFMLALFSGFDANGLLMKFSADGLLTNFTADGLLTNFTAVTTCINNVGPGFGSEIGPTGSFAAFNDVSKVILSLDMLLGRLEIMPLLLLFNPSAWKV